MKSLSGASVVQDFVQLRHSVFVEVCQTIGDDNQGLLTDCLMADALRTDPAPA